MRLFISILLLGFLSFSENSYALKCLKDGGVSTESLNINTSIAVPNNAPKGTVLWRSPSYSMIVNCYQEASWSLGEKVYFYLSPTDQSMTQLGPDLEFGVTLLGSSMTCSQLSRCRVEIGEIPPCIGVGSICKGATKIPLSFSFFIVKKTNPVESANKDGPLTGVKQYDAFQIDGEKGINSNPENNFRMTLVGMDRIRYVGCLAHLSVSPETVNFGKVSSSNSRADTVIIERPFTILISKSCNSVYGVSALMSPVRGTVQNGDTLVPSQNTSVGIRLLRENRTSLPFNQEFELAEPSGDMVISKTFSAQLKWLTNKAILGAFNTGATFDIYYK